MSMNQNFVFVGFLLLIILGKIECGEVFCKNVLNGYCYWEIVEKVSATTAEELCQSQDGHLASIHTQEETDFVLQIRSKPDSNYWIGLIRGSTPWYWTDGSPMDYSNWDPSGKYWYQNGYIQPDGTWHSNTAANPICYSICRSKLEFDVLPDCSSIGDVLNATTLGMDDIVRVSVRTSSLGGFTFDIGVRVITETSVTNSLTLDYISDWNKCDVPDSEPRWTKTSYDCYDEFWSTLNFLDPSHVDLISTGKLIHTTRGFWIHSIRTDGRCSITSYPERVDFKFTVGVSPVSMEKTEDEDDSYPITGIEQHSVRSVSFSDKRLVIDAHLLVIPDVEITSVEFVSGTYGLTISLIDGGIKKQFGDGTNYYDIRFTTTSPCDICDGTFTIKVDIKGSDDVVLPYQYSFSIIYIVPQKDGHEVYNTIETSTTLFSSSSFLPADESSTFKVKSPVFVHTESSKKESIFDLDFKVKDSFVGCSSTPAFQCPMFEYASDSSFEIFKHLITNYQIIEDVTTQVEDIVMVGDDEMMKKYANRFSFYPNFVEETTLCCVYVQSSYVTPSLRRISNVEYVGLSKKSLVVKRTGNNGKKNEKESDDGLGFNIGFSVVFFILVLIISM